MPRKKKAAAPAAAPKAAAPDIKPGDTFTIEGDPVVRTVAAVTQAKAKAGAVAVTSRPHAPYNADGWFVGYTLPARDEPYEDGPFRSEDAANEYADLIRAAYGLG